MHTALLLISTRSSKSPEQSLQATTQISELIQITMDYTITSLSTQRWMWHRQELTASRHICWILIILKSHGTAPRPASSAGYRPFLSNSTARRSLTTVLTAHT